MNAVAHLVLVSCSIGYRRTDRLTGGSATIRMRIRPVSELKKNHVCVFDANSHGFVMDEISFVVRASRKSVTGGKMYTVFPKSRISASGVKN